MAGTQCQAARERPGVRNMKSKPSRRGHGVAGVRGKKRAIWIFWKVTEVTVIRGDRQEGAAAERGATHAARLFSMKPAGRSRELKRCIYFFFLLKNTIPSVHPITGVGRIEEFTRHPRAGPHSWEVRHVTI